MASITRSFRARMQSAQSLLSISQQTLLKMSLDSPVQSYSKANVGFYLNHRKSENTFFVLIVIFNPSSIFSFPAVLPGLYTVDVCFSFPLSIRE